MASQFVYIEKTHMGYRLYFDGEISDIFLSPQQVREMLGDEDYDSFLHGKECFSVPAHSIPRKKPVRSKKNPYTKDMFK